MGLLHSWKAAQGGAPLRGAKRWLHLLPLAGLVQQGSVFTTGRGYEAGGLQRSLSADYSFFMERSKALRCCQPVVTGLDIEQWLGERGALSPWLGLYCQEGV